MFGIDHTDGVIFLRNTDVVSFLTKNIISAFYKSLL